MKKNEAFYGLQIFNSAKHSSCKAHCQQNSQWVGALSRPWSAKQSCVWGTIKTMVNKTVMGLGHYQDHRQRNSDGVGALSRLWSTKQSWGMGTIKTMVNETVMGYGYYQDHGQRNSLGVGTLSRPWSTALTLDSNVLFSKRRRTPCRQFGERQPAK